MTIFKKYIFLTFLVLLSIVIDTSAANCVDAVSRAFEKGNVSELAVLIEGNVSLSLPGAQANYSKAQAEMILQDFFKKNDIRQLHIHRKGDNKYTSFVIGQVVTSKGTYKLYISVKTNDQNCIVKEIRVEK